MKGDPCIAPGSTVTCGQLESAETDTRDFQKVPEVLPC